MDNLCSEHLCIADTLFEYGIKFLTWKNLYIANMTEKMKRIKLDFDEFLYFRHLETFHSNITLNFLTVSNFFFN